MGKSQQDVKTEEATGGVHDSANGSSSQDDVERAPSTGINLIIVGAGFGGLAAALECIRHGHTVQIFDRSESASSGGRHICPSTTRCDTESTLCRG